MLYKLTYNYTTHESRKAMSDKHLKKKLLEAKQQKVELLQVLDKGVTGTKELAINVMIGRMQDEITLLEDEIDSRIF